MQPATFFFKFLDIIHLIKTKLTSFCVTKIAALYLHYDWSVVGSREKITSEDNDESAYLISSSNEPLRSNYRQ